MPTAIEFPSTLPVPDPGAVKPTERRLVSALPGLQQVRRIQADYLATQEVSWLLTPAEAEIMYEWWVSILAGGLWFAADWPLPKGWAVAVRRFIGELTWEHVPGGNWRVKGITEIRGEGELPTLEDPPSAWNPLDILASNPDLPLPLTLTENYRLYTRGHGPFEEGYDAGVRGTKSYGTEGLKRYYEIEVVSIGFTGNEPGDLTENQAFQIGIIDGTSQNVLQAPENDNSEITPNGGGAFVLCMGRFDGVVQHRPTTTGTVEYSGYIGTNPVAGDIYGFAWDIGTDVRIYRNGNLELIVPFTPVITMYPYCSAGLVNIAGPNINGGSESFRLKTGRTQITYPLPTGYSAWG